MQNKKFAVFGIASAAAMLLSACGGNVTPIVQTVVVEKVSTQIVEKIQTSVVKETAAPVVVPTARPEWTTPHPELSKADVRKGIAMCTDRDELIKVSYPFLSADQRKAAVMDSFIPKDSAWYAKTPLAQYPYNMTEANKLLDASGYKFPDGTKFKADGSVDGGGSRTNANGEPLTLKFTTTNAPFRQTWGGAFVRQMAKCGITVLPSYIPGSIWFGSASGLTRRDFELGAFAWVGEPEPPGVTLYACDQIPLPTNNWSGQNYMGWCNEKASSAIKLANNSLSKDERLKQYDLVQQEFAKDMISIPVFQRVEATGANKNLKGLKLDPNEYFSASADQWELPGKDTVVIGLGQEPASMFSLQESAAVQRVVAQLVFGVDVTKYNYDYQPYGLDGGKFPTIENGGATNVEVEVKAAEGVKILNSDGDLVQFVGGKWVTDDGKTAAKTPIKVRDIKGAEMEFKDGVKLPQLTVTTKFAARKWSDGVAVSKDDFALGYKVDCDRDSGAVDYSFCDRTAKYDVVDDNTVKWMGVPGYQPSAYYRGSFFSAYPAHQVIASTGAYKGKKLSEVAAKDFKTLPEIAEVPLGAGPYILKEWKKGQGMTLVANPNYYKGEPKVKTIKIQMFEGNPAGAVAALLSGQVDVVGKETIGAGAELEQVVKAGLEGKISGTASASPTWEHIDINMFVR